MPSSSPSPIQAAIRRELHFFTLYRVLEAALLCLTVFSPVGVLLGGMPRHPVLAMLVAIIYLVLDQRHDRHRRASRQSRIHA